MQVPFIVLSYGDITTDSQRLFSYEYNGQHILPIFSNLVLSQEFASNMQDILENNGDTRKLKSQVCDNKKHAMQLFITIAIYFNNVSTIAFDPIPPNSEDWDKIIQNKKPLSEVIDELQESLNEESKQ